MTTSAHQMVTLTHLPSLAQADFAKAQLEAAGLECLIPDAFTHPVIGTHVRIQVRAADVPEASRILQLDAPRAADSCSDCGSEQVLREPAGRLRRFLAVALFIPVKQHCRCPACGKQWDA